MNPEIAASIPNRPARISQIRILLPEVTPLEDRVRLGRRIETVVAGIGGIVVSSDLATAAEGSGGIVPYENGDIPYDAPFFPDRNLFDNDIQEALSTPIERILVPGGVGIGGSLKGQLRRLKSVGYRNARGVILGGMDYLRGKHGVHVRTQDRLRDGLRRECPDIPIRNAWRPEDAALFCDSLDQIPVYALRDNFLPNLSVPLDRAVIQDTQESIKGFLDRARDQSALTEAERNYNLKALALAFAGAFEAKRQALAQSEG